MWLECLEEFDEMDREYLEEKLKEDIRKDEEFREKHPVLAFILRI